MTRHTTTAGVIDAIAEALTARPADTHLLVLLDFEAALCDPTDLERLVPHRRGLVARLANEPHTSVAITGTRPVSDLRARVGLGEPVVYVGLQGLQISGRGIEFVHPSSADSSGLLTHIARSLEALTNEIPGVRFENHGSSVTLDIREATPEAVDRAEETLYRVASSHFEDGLLRAYRGASTIDVLPALAWNEADAISTLRTELGREDGRGLWPFCVVDDVRGACLFQAIGSDGLCVAVGDRPARAVHRLRNASDVDVLLRRVLGAAAR